MMRALVFALLLPLAWASHAQETPNPEPEVAAQSTDQQITDLDQLLRFVREQQTAQKALLAEREKAFRENKQQQQALLAKAKRDFAATQRKNQPLVAITEANTAEIAKLQEQLAGLVEGMGDISGAFREFSGDFSAMLGESMITAQFPERSAALQALAQATTQPTIGEIESLWLLVQQEMTEAGKIARFTAPVVSPDGLAKPADVMRIGPFSAFDSAGFLRFIPETAELLALSRQPGSRYVSHVQGFYAGDPGIATAVVDPTRGSLLGMMSYTPSLRERIEQGGTIGLIIIGLGIFGLLLTAWRSFYLAMVYLRIRHQLRNLGTPGAGNPLGRVIQAVKGVSADDEDLLQLKLDEAILAEIPALERGAGLIKLLAAISPLLGLLGTVTGMILTFQAISLFGTGDPKLMAGGISQALVTTVLGLVVAIPLLFGHSLVAALSRSIVQRLDEQCAGILAREAERQGRS
jgi:biopolymer transport protein ExbB